MILRRLQLFPLRSPLVKFGDDLIDIILKSVYNAGLKLEDGDIIAISSKVLVLAEKGATPLNNVYVSEKAKQMASKYDLEPEFVELVLREAEEIYGGVRRAILTLKNGMFIPNAGIDHKNAPENCVVLPVRNPREKAKEIRVKILERTGRKVGIIIVDSGLTPLRLGTRGIAIAASGFKPIRDYRGKTDLYGKNIYITLQNLADDLASAAHVLMGEGNEKIPIVLIRGAPIEFTEEEQSLTIDIEKCIFKSMIKKGIKSEEK